MKSSAEVSSFRSYRKPEAEPPDIGGVVVPSVFNQFGVGGGDTGPGPGAGPGAGAGALPMGSAGRALSPSSGEMASCRFLRLAIASSQSVASSSAEDAARGCPHLLLLLLMMTLPPPPLLLRWRHSKVACNWRVLLLLLLLPPPPLLLLLPPLLPRRRGVNADARSDKQHGNAASASAILMHGELVIALSRAQRFRGGADFCPDRDNERRESKNAV
jgi:hypothetical protein